MRRYRFTLRFIEGNKHYFSTGKDVSNAFDKLHSRMKKRYGMSPAELSVITDDEATRVWNPKTKRWVKFRPWYVEEKKLYPWEEELKRLLR